MFRGDKGVVLATRLRASVMLYIGRNTSANPVFVSTQLNTKFADFGQLSFNNMRVFSDTSLSLILPFVNTCADAICGLSTSTPILLMNLDLGKGRIFFKEPCHLFKGYVVTQ